MGCIVFSQYYDTAYWVAESLTARMPCERVDLYAGAAKSGVTIEDEGIDNIGNLQEFFSQFTRKKQRANAFDLRYGKTVIPEGPGWELCEKVLARRDVVERLSAGW